VLRFSNVSYRVENRLILNNLTFDLAEGQTLVLLGRSGSGKTTALKMINALVMPTSGEVLVDGQDVRRWRNVYELRRKIGMVFPLPVGLPLSVYENVAYAPRRAGVHDRRQLDPLVETCLRQAMLWDEVKDRLDILGTRLSGGQQQRLTLARALSHQPEILCLDEFSIAIDPVTTMKIEDILRELKERMTIVLVTNLVQQARRLADRTAFFSQSRLIEVDSTEKIFTSAAHRLTERYVNGDFG